jgi:hypothetical protein
MVSVEDIFHKIAQDFRSYSGLDRGAAIDEFISGHRFDLHLAITSDVEETELDFLERYGSGHTFYFRLADYDHGKLLAGQIYWILLGSRPDLSTHQGERFKADDKLFLLIHVRNLNPPPPAAVAN